MSNIPQPIKLANNFQTSIEIISHDDCEKAIEAMQNKFNLLFPDPSQVSVIPVLRAGKMLGDRLASHFNIETNPMRMSYYNEDTSRREKPICILKPDMNKIIIGNKTLPILFVETVVESQGTLKASISEINKMIDEKNVELGTHLSYPEYYTFALVSKTGDKLITIPNLTAMFRVDPDIWVLGYGCDIEEKGRDLEEIRGILSPFYSKIPQSPYAKPLFDL
jgi:hypoxanthine-guanine phosphoribosyltransferase